MFVQGIALPNLKTEILGGLYVTLSFEMEIRNNRWPPQSTPPMLSLYVNISWAGYRGLSVNKRKLQNLLVVEWRLRKVFGCTHKHVLPLSVPWIYQARAKIARRKKTGVEASMTYEQREEKTVNGKERTCLIYRCPKSNCASATIKIRGNLEYQNPYANLSSFSSRGSNVGEREKVVQFLYNDARQDSKTSGGSIKIHLKAESLTERDTAVTGYSRLVFLWIALFCTVVRIYDRKLCLFDVIVSSKTFKKGICKLIEHVEPASRKMYSKR